MRLNYPTAERTLALAGIFQSAGIVHQLARKSSHDDKALLVIANSLLKVDSASIESLYDSTSGVKFGLELIQQLFSKSPLGDNQEVIHYAVATHQLHKRLRNSPYTQNTISTGLSELGQRYNKETVTTDQDYALIEDLAALYSRSLSYLKPQIMVHGEPGKIENPLTVSRIRTALFGGVRASYLWHQMGGRRWHFLLHRKTYLQHANRILGSMNE